MILKTLLPVLALLALAGCAQKPLAPEAAQPAEPVQAQAEPATEQEAQEAEQARAHPEPEPPAEQLVLPNLELTDQMLYEFLLAEIAGQRGNLGVSTSAYLSLARSTRDPRVAKRATEIAVFARMPNAALEAASIWVEAQPDSAQARQTLAGLLVSGGRLAEARPHMEYLLSNNQESAGKAFMQLNALLARHGERGQVLQLVRDLAAGYPDLPEAHFAIAQAAFNAGDDKLALAEIKQALALQPDWDAAAVYQAQIMGKTSNAEALAFLKGYLAKHPKSREVRLHYARLLVGERQLAEARDEFRKLVDEFPDSPDVKFAVGLLSMQLNELDLAETYFKQVLQAEYKDKNSVRLYLGQIAEERKRYAEALQWYSSVEPGEQFLAAQLRHAAVLSKQGQLEAALDHLRKLDPQNEQQQVQIVLAEAQFLRNAKSYTAAYDVLDRALIKRPDNPDLLYDHAMAAEKLDRLDVLEGNLRKLIQLKPEHAHAWNALGYTLADRTQRLDEARGYIAKALELSPDDPFIMDSMGWVYYRMGDLDKALEYLKKAHAQRPDPEISAHLGEVLWAKGRKDEARRIWGEALREHPSNEVLQETIAKYKP